MDRRKFFKIAGITVGAGAVSCAGLGYLALQEPKIDFSTFSCGEDSNMGDRILVAYASKCGSTGGVAEAVAKVFCEAGAPVDVKRVQDVKDLKPYRAAVLGSAMRMEKPLSEAVNFAKKHRAALAALPVACFSVGMTMNTDTPENREKAKEQMASLTRETPASLSLGLFGGKLDYSTLSPVFRWMFSQDKSGEMAEGDWRNWDAIRAWANDLIPLLKVKV
jgi:menaquinone-dependent protoporphyrinogen oxidase